MVINHLEKLFVTSDAGTILKELEVGTSHRLRQSRASRRSHQPKLVLS